LSSKTYCENDTSVWKSVAAQYQFSSQRYEFRQQFEQKAVQMNITQATGNEERVSAILF
jgi:hypothetical protein